MRKYETLFVLKPDLEKEVVEELIGKVKTIIEADGTVENVNEWGKRKLAYEIQKVSEGHYTLINFNSEPELPKELDRVFRITDSVIRHIIINPEK